MLKAARKKKRLRSKADVLWFRLLLKRNPTCLLCGKPAQQVHHFFSKNTHGYLRCNLDNGISLCRGCHFTLHHKDPSLSAEIVEIKGKEWYDSLKAKVQEKHYSFQTLGYYQKVIDELNKLK